MRDVSNLDKALEEAQRVARLPSRDRLDGVTGPAAEDAAVAVLLEAGMTAADAGRIVSAIFWGGWQQGCTAGITLARKEQ